jgi:hypothetical protein
MREMLPARVSGLDDPERFALSKHAVAIGRQVESFRKTRPNRGNADHNHGNRQGIENEVAAVEVAKFKVL